MARKAAAMPQPVCRNCRRLSPRCLPCSSASSKMRRSTFFWVSVWGGGRYSPFDTICVGTGVAADAVSAPATRRCSRSLSQLPIVVLPSSLLIEREASAPLAARAAFLVGLQGHRPDQGPRRTRHRLLAPRTIGRRMRRNPDDRRTLGEASMAQETWVYCISHTRAEAIATPHCMSLRLVGGPTGLCLTVVGLTVGLTCHPPASDGVCGPRGYPRLP